MTIRNLKRRACKAAEVDEGEYLLFDFKGMKLGKQASGVEQICSGLAQGGQKDGNEECRMELRPVLFIPSPPSPPAQSAR